MIECLPIDDSQKHDSGGVCTCCPNIIFENGEMIVIHMAFDGRHLVEEVNEILNNPQKQKQWEIVKTI